MLKESFLIALAMVETGHRVNWLNTSQEQRNNNQYNIKAGRKGEDSSGPFQLTKIAVDEANRIWALKGLPDELMKYSERTDWQWSALATSTILEYHRNRREHVGITMDYADLAAMHRWGPTRWNKNRKNCCQLDRERSCKIKLFMESWEAKKCNSAN